MDIIKHNFTDDGRVNLTIYIPHRSPELHQHLRPLVLVFPAAATASAPTERRNPSPSLIMPQALTQRC